MARRKAPVVWFDIPVTDFAKAEKFYRALFGWSFTPAGKDYLLIDAGQSIDGGLSKREGPPPSGHGTKFFVEVSDVEATIVRAQRLGAELHDAPEFLSREAGVVASIRDPDGNVIGLWAAE